MFVSLNQFYVFMSCVMFGAMGGVVYSVLSILRLIIKNKVFNGAIDAIFMLVLSFIFSVFSYKSNFPNIRFYMMGGVLLGLILYLKSFHIILAKFVKKFYNITIQKFKKGLEKKNDRKKGKKIDSGVNSGGSFASIYSGYDNGLSNDFNSGQRKTHRLL